MASFFDYIKCFPFKNVLAMPLIGGLLYVMVTVPAMHDSCIVLITLVVKYYFDTSNQSAKKDETISNALTAAQNTPATPQAS
ncbi:MAG: hypothetical protein JWQ66_2953 [Mucilaginibacter sp.]|nr:hypothetical protein [Mucilaginibacter sp.]